MYNISLVKRIKALPVLCKHSSAGQSKVCDEQLRMKYNPSKHAPLVQGERIPTRRKQILLSFVHYIWVG